MKKSYVKLFALLLALSVLFAGLLTGCASTSQTPAPTQPATDTPAPAAATPAPAAETPVPAAATATPEATPAAPAQKIQVVLLTRWSGADANGATLQQLVSEFNAQHNDIEIVDQSIADGDAYMNKISAAIGTGALPNIFQVWGEGYDYAKNGLLLDMTPYYDADKEWSGGFLPGLTAAVGQYPGMDGLYVVPMETNFEVWYYNTDLFTKAGIDKAPDTWDEFLADIQKLKDAKIVPCATGGKDAWRLAHIFNGLMHRNVGVQTSLDLGIGKTKFTDANIVDTIGLLKKLVDVGAFDKNFLGIDYTSEQANFFAGKAAMTYNGTWFNGSVADSDIKGKIKQFLMPIINPQFADNNVGYSNGWVVSNLIKDEAEKNATIEVMKYLSSAYATNLFVQNVKRPSTRTDIATDINTVDPLLSEIMTLFKDNVKVQGGDVSDYTRKAKMAPIIQNGLVSIAMGDMTPEQIAQQWDAEMQKD